MRLVVNKDTATLEDVGDDSFVSKLIAGCKGKVTIKTPFGIRKINKIIRKDSLHKNDALK